MSHQGEVTHAFAEARARRAGVRGALGRLEQAASAPATGRVSDWAADVGASLDDLLASWVAHVETTEAADGLHAEIVERAPRLSHHVGRLRDEHAAIRVQVEDLRATLSGGVGDDGPGEIREAILALLEAIVRHRHRGADVVYEAYNADIGAAD